MALSVCSHSAFALLHQRMPKFSASSASATSRYQQVTARLAEAVMSSRQRNELQAKLDVGRDELEGGAHGRETACLGQSGLVFITGEAWQPHAG